MLVLGRKKNETVIISTPLGDIVLTKLDDRRLGIDAPDQCKILRGELVIGIQDQSSVNHDGRADSVLPGTVGTHETGRASVKG